jgi:hypothetical protein
MQTGSRRWETGIFLWFVVMVSKSVGRRAWSMARIEKRENSEEKRSRGEGIPLLIVGSRDEPLGRLLKLTMII